MSVNDAKKRIMNSIQSYSKKQLPKESSRAPRQKNKAPEKQVEKSVLTWARKHKFSVHVIESKAVYNPKAGRYLTGQTVSGMPDLIGCDGNGFGVFIELKAKGKRSTVRPKQVQFLIDKINHNAFAVVVDSAEGLETFYRHWLELRRLSLREARRYLLESLPKRRVNSKGIQTDEMPF